MFKPTLALMSKASRAPLTSKGGNKEFYKGPPVAHDRVLHGRD